MSTPTILRSDANVYMYITDKKDFDDIALAWYKTSGKFDRNSYGRWLEPKLKTQLIRASIDNSVVFLPTKKPCDAILEDTANHPILICQKSEEGVRISALGIITGYVECPQELFTSKHLMLVHILSTSMASELTLEGLSGINKLEFEQEDYLPEYVIKISDDVSDKVDLGVENLEFTLEYEKHIIFAHMYKKYLDELLSIETPVKKLEDERKKRIMALKFHLEQKKKIQFPIARQEKFSIPSIVKLYKKYTPN
jgi:hypothetical protein